MTAPASPNGHANGQLPPLMVDSSQAAALVNVSKATWHRMVAAGKTPAPHRLSGSCVRFRTSDLEKWVAWGCPDRSDFEHLLRE